MQIVNFDKKKIGNGCGRDLNLDRGKQKNNVKINGTLAKSAVGDRHWSNGLQQNVISISKTQTGGRVIVIVLGTDCP